MKTKLLFLLLTLCSASLFVSCGDDDSSDSKPSDTELPGNTTDLLPEPGFENLTDADFDNYTQDLSVRLLCMLYDPNADYNDIDLIDHYLNGLAYAQATRGTRGVWGQLKAVVDFALIAKNVNTLHRTTIIGAMAKWKFTDKESREDIWKNISKSGCLPSKYNSYTANEFWKEFSMGHLDAYAKNVYDAICDCNLENSKAADFAGALGDHKLRHVDLMLSVAPKLIEAGANIVFAFGDDLISNGKLAYDFVNTNGTVMLQIAEGNLTADAFIDACNNNLKLLTKGLEEVVPTSQDLGELLADLTAEQIKVLNKEIEDAIKRAGNQEISSAEIAMFVDNVKDILIHTPWTMNFADIVYAADDGSTFEIESSKGGGEGKTSYNFTYCDKYESVLLEAKCVVKENYITIRVDYLDERCDLLPVGASLGDVITIPYNNYGASENNPEYIDLWWNSDQHRYKKFHIKREVLFTDLAVSISMYCLPESGGSSTRCYHKLTFKQDEMKVSKQKNLYTVVAEKETDEIHFSVSFKFTDEGVDGKGNPKVSKIQTLEFYRIVFDSYSPQSSSYWGNVHAVINDLKFTFYIDNSNGDKYLQWSASGTEDFTVSDFRAYREQKNTDESTTYIYDSKNGALIEVRGFYQCADISNY